MTNENKTVISNGVDANRVVKHLTNRIASLEGEMALLKAYIEQLEEMISGMTTDNAQTNKE